ncbi:hypothetical protein A9Q84_06160 [Halobacteriovorax marinus]|uniref:Uncharacterized protein n=1 Tax=Halobacteriovorax marinus TaxID=97084 RepID=A0A1Y5FEX1_9BACT|nr:hypothetical protein A9Q84_06160 [Halobacteriovorax marinus]
MKFAFVIVFAFFVSIAARSRDLSYKEKMSVLAVKNHLNLKDYFVGQIDPNTLPLKDYISFKVLEQSCVPVASALENISEAEEELKDQSKKLRVFYEGCMEGTLGLGYLYQKYSK